MSQEERASAIAEALFWKFDALRKGFLRDPIAERNAFQQVILQMSDPQHGDAMNHTIDKTFEFCYGHRVWTQTLNGEYSDDLKCACRHLHGHEARVKVFLTAEHLRNGMVTDFRHLEWLKKWINAYIDHRFIIDKDDPLLPHIFGTTERTPVEVGGVRVADQFAVLNLDEGSPQYELLAGALIVDFVPTSENLAKWMHGVVASKMRALGVRTSRVDWWETPKSRSTYVPHSWT